MLGTKFFIVFHEDFTRKMFLIDSILFDNESGDDVKNWKLYIILFIIMIKIQRNTNQNWFLWSCTTKIKP